MSQKVRWEVTSGLLTYVDTRATTPTHMLMQVYLHTHTHTYTPCVREATSTGYTMQRAGHWDQVRGYQIVKTQRLLYALWSLSQELGWRLKHTHTQRQREREIDRHRNTDNK